MRRRRRLRAPLRGLRRMDEAVTVTFTARETRAVVRGLDLVINTLRPELFRPGQQPPPPMVDAQVALIAAAERAGIDIGLMPSTVEHVR